MGKPIAAPPIAPHVLLGGRHRLGQKLGSGSFGGAFVGVQASTSEDFAVKLESLKAKRPLLMYEARLLGHLQGMPGVPNVRYFGADGDYTVMLMDLLGPSLEDLFNMCGRNDVYLIDFGLAKTYCDPKTQGQLPYGEGNGFVGTSRYSSINAQMGIEQSRRDDLLAIGCTLMYFIRNDRMVLECKRSTPIETLCLGYPATFAAYISYCQTLGFHDRPNYAYLRRLFRDLFVREGLIRDGMIDWTHSSQK
ncbi:unnamed protein product, partial [Prorocentrum cordatum]